LLYLGPETYLPLASVAAGAVGLILTFWRRFVGFLRRMAAKLPLPRRKPWNGPDRGAPL
jgi:hypothetical protein